MLQVNSHFLCRTQTYFVCDIPTCWMQLQHLVQEWLISNYCLPNLVIR